MSIRRALDGDAIIDTERAVCTRCGGPLGDSPSDDYCSEECSILSEHRHRWMVANHLEYTWICTCGTIKTMNC